MNKRDFLSRLYYRACCFVLFGIAAGASFDGFYQENHFHDAALYSSIGTIRNSTFEVMVDGTAPRPFVYRQLLPMLANWIDLHVQGQARDWLYDVKLLGRNGRPFREQFDSPLARDRTYFLRYWIFYALVPLFAWVAVYAIYFLGQEVGYPPIASALIAVGVILLMPFLFNYYYDFLELASLALVAWMAFKFDWWWMVPVVALATWNKESFLLLIPTLYPLLRARSSRAMALVGCTVLGLTCAGVYFLLRIRFGHNPGGTVEMHLMDQMHAFLHPPDLFTIRTKAYGLIYPAPTNMLSVALIVSTIWRGWRHLPRAFQRHAQIAAAINLPLFILFCAPWELRDLSLLYVSAILLLMANVTEWLRGQSNMRSGRSIGDTPQDIAAGTCPALARNVHSENAMQPAAQ
jgi:hypothetical protein